MQEQSRASDDPTHETVVPLDHDARRQSRRERALRSALRKRAAGVPTYTVPEAAALLSVSQEHLYRLIHADAFPAVLMRAGLERGRYVVAAAGLEEFLASARGTDALRESRDAAIEGVR
jgi:excisionase family DNA binding protein